MPSERQAAETVVGKLGMELSYFPYTSPSFHRVRECGELDGVFCTIVEDHCDALVVLPNSATYEVCDRIAQFATDAKLPSASGWSPYAEKGFLTYGPDVRELYRSLASYVDHILHGANPADIPAAESAKLYMAINFKTARALGFAAPPSLLARADVVAE